MVQQLQQQPEDAIQSYNFGGLMTASNPLNIPPTHSPLLLNADIDDNGNVTKRKGTRSMLFRDGPIAEGFLTIPFVSTLGYNYTVTKEDLAIKVYNTLDNVTSLLLTKENVWTSAVSRVRPTYAITSEAQPRIIMCTGANAPVELKFTESSLDVAPTTATTTTVFGSASPFKNASTVNCLVYFDRTRVVSPTFTYDATTGNLTVGGLPSHTGAHTVDLVFVVWGVWVEAIRHFGYELYDTTTRFHVAQTDNNVAVPEGIWADAEPLGTAQLRWPILAYPGTTGSGHVLNGSRNPATANEYSFSDGTAYKKDTPVVGVTTNPSPLFITFGAITASSPPTAVHFVRGRALNFRGNLIEGVEANYFQVYVDGVEKPQLGNPHVPYQYGTWSLRYHADYNLVPDGATPAKYITFDRYSENRGLPKTAIVDLIQKKNYNNVGTAFYFENVGRATDIDGWRVPAYGIQNFSNYRTNSHPRNVALYQGRLVFGGWKDNPLLVAFSAVYDANTPGVNFQYFQVGSQNTSQLDALDVLLPSSSDDRVTAIVEWQSSLFILTRKAVFRLYSGEGQQLNLTSRYVSFVSNRGLVNPHCVVRTDDSVLYLTDRGLYSLGSATQSGEYDTRDKSESIRDMFGLTTNLSYESLAWVAWDGLNQFVYIGYPTTESLAHAKRLLVYNNHRGSWTEYDTPNGFNPIFMSPYTDRALGAGMMMSCSRYSGLHILKMNNDDTFIDFARYVNMTTANLNTLRNLEVAEITHTTNTGQQEYRTSYSTIPLSNIYDSIVTLNGVVQEPGVDWRKLPNGSIWLNSPPGGGITLTIRMKGTHGNSPVCVFLNGEHLDEDVHYTVSGNIISMLPGVLSDTETNAVIVGQVYNCIYTSPMFSRQRLDSFKRLRHILAYFDNRNRKARLNANISCLYSSEMDGETSADIYQFDEIAWDVDNLTSSQFQLFKEAIQGVGYSFQFMLWSSDEATFRLCGYQIDAKLKGKRYAHKGADV